MNFPESSPPSEAFPTAVEDHLPHRSTVPAQEGKTPTLARWGLIGAATAALLVAVLILAGCAAGSTSDESSDIHSSAPEVEGQTTFPETIPETAADYPAAIPDRGMHLVAETSGGTGMDVTYLGRNLEMGQELGAASPWSATVPADDRLDLLGANMNAQNLGDGTVTCRIYWDGEVVEENSAQGKYAMASCTLPVL